MNLEEIKKYLTEYLIEEGYNADTINDDDLEELLLEEEVIHTEDVSSHRWYDTIEKIVKVKDKYFSYEWYHITGDNGPTDMGLTFEWKSVKEVEPYEVVATKFRII